MDVKCISNRQGPPAKRGKVSAEEFICEGNKSVFFKLVRRPEDIDNDVLLFTPDMTHQIFGEKEMVFGYKNLSIDLWYSACQLKMYFNVSYESKIDSKRFDDIKADDVESLVKDKVELPPGYFTDKQTFLKSIEEDKSFVPFGKRIHEYTRNGANFEIYRFSLAKESQDAKKAFREYHKRMQTFLLFFVDGGSYIEDDDDRWVFYNIYEKVNDRDGNAYCFVGYQTVYRYFVYQKKEIKYRPRISQVLVLPPFQRQGHCVEMLRTFYKECMVDDSIVDITVEDPSENYQRVRDFVDAIRAMETLECFRPPGIFQSWSTNFAQQATRELKMNKRQARRIYELLRLFYTNREDEQGMRGFRLAVKRRLNIPFKRSGRDFEKLRRALSEAEWKSDMVAANTDQRFHLLEEGFKEMAEYFDKVIERLHKQGYKPESSK